MRDAAAYVCWAFARAYSPEALGATGGWATLHSCLAGVRNASLHSQVYITITICATRALTWPCRACFPSRPSPCSGHAGPRPHHHRVLRPGGQLPPGCGRRLPGAGLSPLGCSLLAGIQGQLAGIVTHHMRQDASSCGFLPTLRQCCSANLCANLPVQPSPTPPQECVGRLGSFPHGIEILTTADYFTVSVRQNVSRLGSGRVGSGRAGSGHSAHTTLCVPLPAISQFDEPPMPRRH